MKKVIGILTATRAEYGLLKNIILKLNKKPEYDVRVLVTGMHLSSEFGYTYKEIEKDGINIDKKVEILLSSDDSEAVSKSMGLAMIGFGEYFREKRPDMLIVLGDRYETLAVCMAASNARIPIAHLYGGEITEGALDNAIRHSISKLSYLHFTSTEEYRKRVIQLGEEPSRVFCVGAMGIENIVSEKLMTKEELEKSIGMKLDVPYSVVTFHPVTLEENTAGKQIDQLLKYMDSRKDMKYIITKANADEGGQQINQKIDDYVNCHNNAKAFFSLGIKRYLSALKYAHMIMGNSSSGLLEAPSFKIPTINIGDRQKGRITAESVICCKPEFKDIKRSVERAETVQFRQKLKDVKNPYGDGNTSEKIIEIINREMYKGINLKKKFYDITFDYK